MFLAVCLALAVSLGVTLSDNDNDDDEWKSVSTLDVGEIYSFDLTKSGEFLAVIGDGDESDNLALHLFEWTNNKSWTEKTSLALVDEHSLTHPDVQVAYAFTYLKVLVTDSHAVEQENDQEGPFGEYQTYTGLSQVYSFFQQDGHEGTLQLDREFDYAGEMCMDDYGQRLALGDSSFDDGEDHNVGSVQVVSLTSEDTTYGGLISGDNVHGFLGESLDLSGSGRVLVSGSSIQAFDPESAGEVRTWHWDNAAEDWMERTNRLEGKPGQGLGAQVVLNRDGDVMAVTTGFTRKALVYQYKTGDASEAFGSWELMGEPLEGVTSVAMTSDGERIVTVDQASALVQVYNWSVDTMTWVPLGDSIVDATAARLSDDGSLLVERRYSGDNGTFLQVLRYD